MAERAKRPYKPRWAMIQKILNASRAEDENCCFGQQHDTADMIDRPR
jgi:hypothetical protein